MTSCSADNNALDTASATRSTAVNDTTVEHEEPICTYSGISRTSGNANVLHVIKLVRLTYNTLSLLLLVQTASLFPVSWF